MKKEIQIKVPTDWSAVTLQTYLDLQKDLKTYGETEEGYVACLFHHLTGFPVEWIKSLDIDTFISIKNDLVGFMGNVELPLKKFVHIDGVEYGFEPNLSKMAYGAYLDIVNYDTFQIDDNWSKVMSILYRPVTKRMGDLYEIKDYDGDIDGVKFLNVGMDTHWGALFFFVRILTELLNDTLNSLMEQVEIPHNIKSILAENGKTTPLSFNSPVEILERLKKLQSFP